MSMRLQYYFNFNPDEILMRGIANHCGNMQLRSDQVGMLFRKGLIFTIVILNRQVGIATFSGGGGGGGGAGANI